MTEEIVLAYVNKGRLKVNRPNQVVLIIFDALRGQITDDVLKLFKQNHIDTVFVPANMNGILRPLDLTVIGFAKFCEKKFNHQYMEQIMERLDDGKSIQEIDVKLQLTILKLLHAYRLIKLFNEITKSEGKEVIMSGFKAAGIIEAIEKGSTQLESLDPFSDLDLLLTQTPMTKYH